MKFAINLLVICVGALLSLGMVMLYSAGMLRDGPARYLTMQLVWCCVGLVACFVAAWLDYGHLRKFSWPLFVLAVILLALVLVPGIGTKANGAQRWFRFGVFSFQPSEIGKIGLIVMLAYYGERYQRFMPTFWRGLAIPGTIAALVLGLIFVEPDRGTTILLGAVSGIMLLIAGVRWHFILPPAAIALTGLGYSLYHDPVRAKRILSWLYPEEFKQSTGYQAYQAMVALGSGGWTGLGLGNGRQKLGFVPEHHTDFIFSVIGEELGLVATLGVIVAFVLLVICGLYIAWNSRDLFGTLLGSGITFLIGLQAFINIGVVTGALPNKGLPLPFISYGGSNLLIMLMCVGVLVSIGRHAGEVSESVPADLRVSEIVAT